MPTATRQYLPNLITMGRLALSGALFVLLATCTQADERPFWGVISAAVFTLAASTDALDGYLARKWGVVTTFGRVMDPFCDKVLVLGGFILVAAAPYSPASGVAPWMVVLMLSRELFVTSLRAVAESIGHPFPADRVGKYKMVIQSIALGVSILAGTRDDSNHFIVGISKWLVIVAVIATVASAYPYVRRGWTLLFYRASPLP